MTFTGALSHYSRCLWMERSFDNILSYVTACRPFSSTPWAEPTFGMRLLRLLSGIHPQAFVHSLEEFAGSFLHIKHPQHGATWTGDDSGPSCGEPQRSWSTQSDIKMNSGSESRRSLTDAEHNLADAIPQNYSPPHDTVIHSPPVM